MLAAERDAIQWTAYTDALEILVREMAVIINYLENLGNQAALVAGFAITCYMAEMGFPSDTVHPVFEGAFFCCVTISVTTMLFCVVTSTLVTSLGPERGLRGQDSTSMRVAVEHMKSSRAMIRRSFGIGCVTFIAAVFQILWHKVNHSANSAVCTGLATGIFYYLLRNVRAIFTDFTEDAQVDASVACGPGTVTAAEYINKARAAARLPVAATRRRRSANGLTRRSPP